MSDLSTLVGHVLGSQEATPLEFWVAVKPGQVLRLDDVVLAATTRPDTQANVTFYGVVDHVRTLYEGTQFDTDTFLASEGKGREIFFWVNERNLHMRRKRRIHRQFRFTR
jgi:hypothetical protein